MIDILKTIPISIWSVVLGSLIAFSGVLISNWNNTRRLKIQLRYDAEIKAIDRKATLRRDVYLTAVEELVKANSYLGTLTQVDPINTNLAEPLQPFFATAAKLALVAEEETGKALNELVISYSGLIFKLMIKLSPISDSKIDLNLANSQYDEEQAEIKRILAAMTNQNESGRPDKNVFDALSNSFDHHKKRSDELANERNECWDKINKYTKEFSIYLAHEMKNIALLQVPVMLGIRKELDIDTDAEGYRKLVQSNAEKISKQLDELLVSLENPPA